MCAGPSLMLPTLDTGLGEARTGSGTGLDEAMMPSSGGDSRPSIQLTGFRHASFAYPYSRHSLHSLDRAEVSPVLGSPVPVRLRCDGTVMAT